MTPDKYSVGTATIFGDVGAGPREGTSDILDVGGMTDLRGKPVIDDDHANTLFRHRLAKRGKISLASLNPASPVDEKQHGKSSFPFRQEKIEKMFLCVRICSGGV